MSEFNGRGLASGKLHRVQRALATAARAPTPLVFASPHSGRVYPEDMRACLSGLDLRRSEDAFVDRLVDAAPVHGAALITALAARAYLDVNRQAYELDPDMFVDPLPPFADVHSPRVAAGLGSVARLISEGQHIYSRKLTFAEVQGRIDKVHTPYHEALAGLISEARAAFGFAILIDWHSMPAAAARLNGTSMPCDIILGDRHGAACHPDLTARVESDLRAMGYSVVRNIPYAGGYTTEHYGRPGTRVHALQIEISRQLYLDESCLKLTEGFGRLKANISRLSESLAAETWDQLRYPPPLA